MKSPMHLDGDKHPFQKNGKTPKPKMGRGAGAHPTAKGNQPAMISANASRKR